MRGLRPLHFLISMLAMFVFVLAGSGIAFADQNPGTSVINGASSVVETMTAPTIPAVTLAGVDQTVSYTLPITVNDATGTGNGWNLTLTSTTFSTGGGSPHKLADDASTITGVTSSCVVPESGTITCTDPTNSISYPLAVPAATSAPTPVKFFNADVNTGMGQFTVTPTISIAIPANTYASTSGYSSTLTIAVVSGP